MAQIPGTSVNQAIYNRFPALGLGQDAPVTRSILDKLGFANKQFFIPSQRIDADSSISEMKLTGQEIFDNINDIEKTSSNLFRGQYQPDTKRLLLGESDSPDVFFHELGHSVSHTSKRAPAWIWTREPHFPREAPWWQLLGEEEGRADAFMKRIGEVSGAFNAPLSPYSTLGERVRAKPDSLWRHAIDAGYSEHLRPGLLAVTHPSFTNNSNAMQMILDGMRNKDLTEQQLAFVTQASAGYEQGFSNWSRMRIEDAPAAQAVSGRPRINLSNTVIEPKAAISTGITKAAEKEIQAGTRPVIRLNSLRELEGVAEVAQAVTKGSRGSRALRSLGLRRLLR